MKKHKRKHRSRSNRERSRRRTEIYQERQRKWDTSDSAHIVSYSFLFDRFGNAKLVRSMYRKEERQRKLREGELHLKGKSVRDGASRKKYGDVSTSNPQLPVVYREHGFASPAKPKRNRQDGDHCYVFSGDRSRWYSTSDINNLIAQGKLSAEEAYGMIQKIKQSLTQSPEPNKPKSIRGMDHLESWKVNELVDALTDIQKRFKIRKLPCEYLAGM